MTSSSTVAACIALVLALGVGRPARAGEEDGKTMFAAGRQLRSQGKCDEAIVQFRRALEAYPEGLGSLRNIAECEEQLGWFAAARRDWWDLRRAVLQTNQPKYESWEKDAEAAYARLAGRVSHVTVKLENATPEKIRVVIDGKPLDPRLVGVELERDLGAHTAEAYYGGAAPVTQKFTLSEGAHDTVTLAIPADAPGDASMLQNAKTSPTPTEAPPPSTGLRTAGFVSLGAGVVGIAGLVASIAIRQSALSNIDGECSSHTDCPTDLQSDRDRGATASMLANVFGAVAIVGIGTGVTLLVLSGSRSSKQSTAIAIGPSPGGMALRASGAF